MIPLWEPTLSCANVTERNENFINVLRFVLSDVGCSAENPAPSPIRSPDSQLTVLGTKRFFLVSKRKQGLGFRILLSCAMGGLRLHRNQALILLAVFLIEVAIIVPVIVTQWQQDVAATRSELRSVSDAFAITMNSTLRLFLHGVTSASGAVSSLDGWVTIDQLGQALQLDTSPLQALRQAYVWVALVSAAERPDFERFYNTSIKDWNGSLPPVVSGSRPFYWAFSAFQPVSLPGLQRLFGVDAITADTSDSLLRNESTHLVMPGSLGILSDASANNFAIGFIHRNRRANGVLRGVVSARDLLEYTLQVMQMPRRNIVLAAYAPLRWPQLLYLETSDLLGNATTLKQFYALPNANEFFVHNITFLDQVLTVCMRFDSQIRTQYAVNTWMILTAVLVPVAFLVLGVVFVILVKWQHRKYILQLETDKRRESQLMLGYVSHEIRNPLQTILGMSDLCLEEISDNKELLGARSYVETIVRSAEFIEHIANDILDMRRIEEGQITLDVKDVSVNILVASLERSVVSFAKPEVQFEKNISEDPSFLQTDRHRLEQILLNFLSNAFKYTKKGSVTLSFARSGARKVRFSVSDTGRGIPPEMLDSIFEQFKQVKAGDSSTGFGLGLFLSKRIAILLGGSVGVESSERGSTFWLELPISDLASDFELSAVPLGIAHVVL